MTERGRTSLDRSDRHLRIGPSTMCQQDNKLVIEFAEMALPWPGQRLLPKRMSGRVELVPDVTDGRYIALDADGRHVWSPRMPRAAATVICDALPGGGWQGHAYHDMNFGDRPIEQDFIGWDWARGSAGDRGDTVILYDAVPRTGANQRLCLRYDRSGIAVQSPLPQRGALPSGFWGVRCGVACDADAAPKLVTRLEDAPFYTRTLIETTLGGTRLAMVHETLDCRRLANPLVRMLLPFRMPRRARYP